MATESMTLLDQIEKAAASGDVDVLRQAVKTMAEALMELEVAAKLGAAPYERTADRTGYRNGHRVRTWDTRVGRTRRRESALYLVFKIIDRLSLNRQLLRGDPALLRLVVEGARFEDGILAEPPSEEVPAA